MNKCILILLGSLVNVLAMAAPITPDQARQQAEEFLAQRGNGHGPMRMVKQQPRLAQAQQAGDAAYYVFNIGEEQGFVIVSGDDRTTPVLGYARNGQFSEQDMPDNMRAWLEGYADQIRWMDEHGYGNSATPRKVNGNAINQLLTTTWNQGDPYNYYCPSDAGGLCVTGCVATAMAQVLAYHGLVNSATLKTSDQIPGYRNRSNTVTVEAKDPMTFDVANMLTAYTYKNNSAQFTDTERNAVAHLMEYCGSSVEMNYRSSSSGAYSEDVAPALRKYFGFNAQFVVRDQYTYSAWEQLIYDELAASRPVYYSGSSSGGGHAFVIDGYDGNGLFHVNWGWGGNCDGDFVLSVLNPDDNSGIGASSSNDGYSFEQDAVIGVEPGTGVGEGQQLDMHFTSVSGNTITVTASNYTGKQQSFDYGIGYKDNSNQYVVIGSTSVDNLNNRASKTASFTVSGLSEGTYNIVGISRVKTADDSNPWLSQMTTDHEYVVAVVDASSNVTLTLHPQPALAVTEVTLPVSNTYFTIDNLTVEATITNTGEEFLGRLYCFAKLSTSSTQNKVATTGITVEPNSTATLSFSFVPDAEGTWEYWVATDQNGNNVITGSQGSVVITANPKTFSGDFILSSMTVDDADESSWRTDSEGNKMVDVFNNGDIVLSLKVKNISTTTDHEISPSQFIFELQKKEEDGWKAVKSPKNAGSFTLKKGEEITFNKMRFTGMAYGAYRMVLKEKNNDTENIRDDRYHINTAITKIPSYSATGEEGNFLLTSTTVTLPDDLTVADLRELDLTTFTVNPSANPNCLYLLESGQSATSLNGKNVVVGSTAAQITLTDDGTNGFYSPIAFTATNISYTRTFSTGYNTDGSGWTTITLPFEVSQVYVEGETNPIDWYHSGSDTGKRFWVMAFTGDNGSTVNFTQAATMQANQPYLITVPGTQFAAKWRLTGKPITFKGTNATITNGNVQAEATGSSYKLAGTFATTDVNAEAYSLNAAGNSFEKGKLTEAPFRAYFLPTSTTNENTSLYIAFGGSSTGIDLIPTADVVLPTQNTLFDLQGRRLNGQPTHGIYIVNGKKIIK